MLGRLTSADWARQLYKYMQVNLVVYCIQNIMHMYIEGPGMEN